MDLSNKNVNNRQVFLYGMRQVFGFIGFLCFSALLILTSHGLAWLLLKVVSNGR